MDKQALLEQVYEESFKDEMQKIAGKTLKDVGTGTLVGAGVGGTLGAAKLYRMLKPVSGLLPMFSKSQLIQQGAKYIGSKAGKGALLGAGAAYLLSKIKKVDKERSIGGGGLAGAGGGTRRFDSSGGGTGNYGTPNQPEN